MKSKVLITGGSGLVGTKLSSKLTEQGYEVIHLSRFKSKSSKYKTFTWDIASGIIEDGAFENIHSIVHLAGAGVADKRWTKDRKQELTSSRVDSANLIFKTLKYSRQKIDSFISASAIGIYGFDTGGIVQTEDRIQLGDDFLATLTKKWESAADQFSEIDARVVKLRIGLVLSNDGGLLAKLKPIANMGLSSAFGSGSQFMSWIHGDDLVNMIIYSIEKEKIAGPYNAVAPNPVNNKEFLKELSNALKKPYFLPNTPKFVLKLVMGELASAITGGNNVSSQKIQDAGFEFEYEKLDESLTDLLCK